MTTIITVYCNVKKEILKHRWVQSQLLHHILITRQVPFMKGRRLMAISRPSPHVHQCNYPSIPPPFFLSNFHGLPSILLRRAISALTALNHLISSSSLGAHSKNAPRSVVMILNVCFDPGFAVPPPSSPSSPWP